MKIGMHVSVIESGARGVLVGLEGETATVRLRNEDKTLSASESTYAVSALKGEKGRPVRLDRLAAQDATVTAEAPAAETAVESETSTDEVSAA